MQIETWHVAIVMVATLSVLILAIGWLTTKGYREVSDELAKETEASLAMFLIYQPLRMFWMAVTAFTLVIGLMVLLVWQSWLSSTATVAICLASLPIIRKVAQQRRTNKIEQQLPDALRLLANSLQAGLSLSPALALTAQQTEPPLATELKLVVQRQRTGDTLAEAFSDFHLRARTAMVQFFTLTIVTSATHGGQQADVLARMAQAIQQQHYAKQRILSLSAQARLQGRVMFFLPFLLFWAINSVHEASAKLLIDTDAGNAILLLCGCLMAVGFFLTRRILGQFYAAD